MENLTIMFNRWEGVDQEIYVRSFNVAFLVITCILNGLSLEIKESQLTMGNVIMNSDSGRSHKDGHVFVTNSTWQHLEVNSGFQISVLECNVDGINLETSILMNITESEITIKDLLFYNFNVSRGTAILNAIQSKVAFTNVQFIANQGPETHFTCSKYGSERFLVVNAFKH